MRDMHVTSLSSLRGLFIPVYALGGWVYKGLLIVLSGYSGNSPSHLLHTFILRIPRMFSTITTFVSSLPWFLAPLWNLVL